MENSTFSMCVVLLQKREILDIVYRGRQLVSSALARVGQSALNKTVCKNLVGTKVICHQKYPFIQ